MGHRVFTLQILLIVGIVFGGMPHAMAFFGKGKEIFIALRSDGNPGHGKEHDPYDGSNPIKFDRILRTLYLAGATNVTIHLGPGTFLTYGNSRGLNTIAPRHPDGWRMLGGWKLIGSGRDVTILKLAGIVWPRAGDHFGSPADLSASCCVVESQWWNMDNLLVKDLTVDCNLPSLGSVTTQSFIGPAPEERVSLSVASGPTLLPYLGKGIVLSSNSTDPGTTVIGGWILDSIAGNTVVLRNHDPEKRYAIAGCSIPGGMLILPLVNLTGVSIGASHCTVENVHVMNGAAFKYEGGGGIILCDVGAHTIQGGNLLANNLVDHVWGEFGWLLHIVANNPDTGDNGNFISALVTGNTVHGNGFCQATGGWGMKNSTWSSNNFVGASTGFWIDVGYNRDIMITNNIFDCGQGLQIGGGYTNGWQRFTIGNNRFKIAGRDGILWNGGVSDSQISSNTFRGNGVGIQIRPDKTTNNIIIDNSFSPGFTNSIPVAVGREAGNR